MIRKSRDGRPASRRHCLLLLLMGVAVGCAPGADEGHAEARQDVPISRVVLGSDSALVGPIAGATRLSSGVIAVADGGSRSVAFFDGDGRLLRRAGREGSGPGEFQAIGWMGQCAPDTLVAWDPALQRLSVLDSTGSLVRVIPVGQVWRVACARDGTLAVAGWPGGPPVTRGGHGWMIGDIVMRRLDGSDSVTVRGLPLIRDFPPRPLEPAMVMALSAEHLYVGQADTAAVGRFTRRGEPASAVSTPASARRPMAANWDAAIELFLDEYAPAAARASVRAQVLQSASMPERLPAYSLLVADTDGGVWVQTSVPGDSTTVLVRLGSTGRDPERLVLPRGTRVLEVDDAYVLGASATEEGVAVTVLRRPEKD